MTNYYFAGRAQEYAPFIDYDIITDDPNVYYVLTYRTDIKYWYALRREARDDDSPFDDAGEALREDVLKMLETMPVSALPAEIFI